MAKEKFELTKPHVNVGTIGHIETLDDATGQLTATDTGSTSDGNPAPSSTIQFSAPATSTTQTATVAFPIDDEFFFDPATSVRATSIDFQLDVLPSSLQGAPRIDITLAIIQGEPFITSRAISTPSVDGTELDWVTLGLTGLEEDDFIAVDRGPERPDFSRPFQFGYAFTSEYSTSALNVELGLDNMEVEITTIAEPTSIALAATMGAALLWNRWWGDEE